MYHQAVQYSIRIAPHTWAPSKNTYSPCFRIVVWLLQHYKSHDRGVAMATASKIPHHTQGGKNGSLEHWGTGAQAEPFGPLTYPLHRQWSGTHDAGWDTCSDAQMDHISFVVVGDFFFLFFLHFNWCSTTFFVCVFYVALVKKAAARLPAPHNISAKSCSQGNGTPGG